MIMVNIFSWSSSKSIALRPLSSEATVFDFPWLYLICSILSIPLTRAFRVKIRDISSKIPARNVVLVGGGIGHLAAWLLDLWNGDPANPPSEPRPRPDTFLSLFQPILQSIFPSLLYLM